MVRATFVRFVWDYGGGVEDERGRIRGAGIGGLGGDVQGSLESWYWICGVGGRGSLCFARR